jgi:hypothetical protein
MVNNNLARTLRTVRRMPKKNFEKMFEDITSGKITKAEFLRKGGSSAYK